MTISPRDSPTPCGVVLWSYYRQGGAMAKPQPIPAGTNGRQRKGAKRDSSNGRDHPHDGDVSPDDPNAKQADRLNHLLQQFGGGGFRVLAERTDNMGTSEYLGPIPFTSELYEHIRLRWGGGLFGGRIIDERGKYQTRLYPFRIAGPPRVPGHEDTGATVAVPALPPGLEAILQGMASNLAALVQANTHPAVDPVEHVVKIARALRDTNPVATAQSDPIENMRNMFALIRELREDAPTAPDSAFGAVLKEGVGPLVQVLNRKLDIDEQKATRRAGNVGKVTARVAAAPTVETVSHEETPMTTDELEALLLTVPTPARRFLLDAAANDEDAEDYAPLLLNKLSDDGYAALVRNLGRDDFLDVLIRVVPAYAGHREWFAALVDALRAVAAAPEDGDAATDAAAVTS